MEIPTLINAYSTIKGELVLTTDLRVDGKIFGKVETDQTIVIGTEGYFKGFLRARNLIVFGKIEGNILVSEETTFHPDASFTGTLYTRVFNIKEGATINARIETYDKSKTIDEIKLYLSESMAQKQAKPNPFPPDMNGSMAFDRASETVDGIHPTKIQNYHSNGLIKPDQILSTGKEVERLGYSSESNLNPNELSSEKASGVEDNSVIQSPDQAKDVIQTTISSEIKNDEHPRERVDEQLPDLKSKSCDHQNIEEKTTAKPKVKSVLFSSLLENSIKESSTFLNSNLEVEKDRNESRSAQMDNNDKENNISGYNELRDLLIHPKFPRGKADEKLSGQIKSESNEIEGEMEKETKESDEGEFFHSDVIKQLPTNDI